MTSRRGATGSTVLSAFTVISFLIALGVGESLLSHGVSGEEDSTPLWFVVFTAFVPFALVLLWRMHPVEAVQVILIIGLLLGGIMGLAVWLSAEPHPRYFALTAAGVVVFVGGLVANLRLQRKTCAVGNPLTAMVPTRSILEYGGIQFVARIVPTEFGGSLQLLAQNCFDGTQKLTVTIEPQAAPRTERIVAPFVIPALAVVQLEVPVVVPEGHRTFGLRLETSSQGGQRRRTWTARAYENEVSGTEQLMGMAVGLIRWGGGAKFTFAAGGSVPEKPPAPSSIDLTNTPEVVAAIRATGGPQ